jgi:Ca2+-binding RTX toxin-like protein
VQKLSGTTLLGTNTLVGNVTLLSGAGSDTLSGGAGADVFRFDFTFELGTSTANCDVITDFERGSDRIDLSGLDADGVPYNLDGAFTELLPAGTLFSAAGQLRLDGDVLYGSLNTDAIADFALRVRGVSELSVGDFIL